MTSKFVDKIDPFHKTALRRHRKSEGSSHFSNKGVTELTALPYLKGQQLIHIYIVKCHYDSSFLLQ